MFKKLLLFFQFFTFLFPCLLYAQEGDYGKENISSKLKVYTDENDIDFDFLRTQIDFADFVTDPAVADVHIIIVEETTGSGGANYSLWFNSKTLKNINDFTLNVRTLPNDTEHQIRTLLSAAIIRGLMPYFNETSGANNYVLKLEKLDTTDGAEEEQIDRWQSWMFKLSAWGGLEYEDNVKGYDYTVALKGDKITDQLKIENYIYLRKDILSYQSENETAQRRYIYNYGSTKLTYSLSDKWSVGGAVYAYENSYQNTKFFFYSSLAAEYNFFPWDISNKKILSVAYLAGFQNYVFNDTNIRNKDREFLPMHQLRIRGYAIQPWGEVEVYVTASQNVPEFSLYNLSFDSDFSFRVAKGLSLDVMFGVESIHNQIYIPAKYYSFAEVIIGNIDLPSTIEISATIGITYRFGSIYNNIVNRRL